jgi:NADH:ubiquinone reductase (H+-translocating)
LVDSLEEGFDITVMEASAAQEASPQICIVDGGCGGLSAAKELTGKGLRVALVDRTKHHLFQPLLYQVATATFAG